MSSTFIPSSSCHDIEISSSLPGVVQIKLIRAQSKNALRNQTLSEIASVLIDSKNDSSVKCVVITGSESVFAAGADIKEMQALNPLSSLMNSRANDWKTIRHYPKPLLAAVNGYALGGGCELMMHCDIVIAGDNALIGQPEINLGIIPGAGGTQRLVRSVGKSLAMKMILTGEFIDAEHALQAGLVAEVCPREVTLKRCLEIAGSIAKKAPLALRLAKEAVLSAYEVHLQAGLELERRAFAILAASKDREEGITAFMQKRKPEFKGE